MNKVYILQKDLPDAKAGDKYFWNGMAYSNDNRTARCIDKGWVESIPDWFKEDKSPMEIEWEAFLKLNEYHLGDALNTPFNKRIFESSWSAAEKHFTNNKD